MTFSYDDATREAYAAAPADTVVLNTLEFLHPNFTEPIRVANNSESFTATLEIDAPEDGGQDVLFIACGFQLELPEVGAGTAEMQMTICNVSTEISDALALASDSQEEVTVIYRGCEITDGIARLGMRWVMTMTVGKATVMTATATAGFGDMVNLPFPGLDYNPTDYPGLVE